MKSRPAAALILILSFLSCFTLAQPSESSGVGSTVPNAPELEGAHVPTQPVDPWRRYKPIDWFGIVPSYCHAYSLSGLGKEDKFKSENLVAWDIYINAKYLDPEARQESTKGGNPCQRIKQDFDRDGKLIKPEGWGLHDVVTYQDDDEQTDLWHSCRLSVIVKEPRFDSGSIKAMSKSIKKKTSKKIGPFKHSGMELECAERDLRDEGTCGYCQQPMHGELGEHIVQFWCPTEHRMHYLCRGEALAEQRNANPPKARQCPYPHPESPDGVWLLPPRDPSYGGGFTSIRTYL